MLFSGRPPRSDEASVSYALRAQDGGRSDGANEPSCEEVRFRGDYVGERSPAAGEVVPEPFAAGWAGPGHRDGP